ncbi:neurotrypsin-like [Diadema antillarum]|uniref:neurotrypsin-like n=1 Tax=Diadema antillarum TaxID=105358 RepID=UPI003A85E2E5
MTQEYDVRLVDGPSPQAGRVEIFHDNSWGTICDNTWSSTEAEVVCDQLGYDDVDVALEYFGPGDGDIHINSLSCDGDESSVKNCLYVNFSSTGCNHTEDVGVRCEFTSYEGNARLVGGHISHEGRVEVYHNSQWATVCGDSWDLQDAHVVCRQLGFPEALATIPYVFFDEGNSSQTIVTVS